MNTPTTQEIAQALAEVTESLRRSTVQVRGQRFGAGSGVIWHSSSAERSSLIITNAHVVRGLSAIVELSDERVFEARVIARHSQHDLAALQVRASGLPAATIGNSDRLRVGELVLAVGNPWGVPGVLTTGIIHTASKTYPFDWVQADVRLAPGNSGGPLANAQGEVIGINSMIINGTAIAIPSNRVKQFLSAVQVNVA